MIAIFDYGAGNLGRWRILSQEIGAEYKLIRDAEGLRRASKVVLPGVGHFGQMMRALDSLGVRDAFVESHQAPECRFSASVLASKGSSSGARRRPDVRGLGVSSRA